MTCLEFRRALLIDPQSQDERLLSHQAECESCGVFVENERRFEENVKQAFKVDVPDDVAADILLSQAFDGRSRRHAATRRVLALAASVLLTIGIAVGLLWPESDAGLREAVIAEVTHDRDARSAGPEIELARLNRLLLSLGTELKDDGLGKVVFADYCQIRDRTAVHLILAGKNKPVSAIIMPGQPVDGRVSIEHAMLRGVIMPIRGGSLALVGEQDERLDAVEHRLRSTLRMRM